MDIQITIDKAEFDRFASLGPAVVRAARKAGSDALRKMRKTSTQTIRFRKRIKLKVINDSLVMTFPKGAQTLDSLEWRMDVKGTRAPVSAFEPRQRVTGVSVAINAGKRKIIKGAFIARMRSGHVGVWLRDGSKRLPIHELYTTRVSDLFGDNGMVPAVIAQTLRAFDQTFGRVLPLELGK